ncbi:Ras-related protein Rab-22A [Liparis tanakae]|uniref:Ras-related protein Rab-22A n=1 Tax=Liparis tanakae TaxID=230148 RepID=A0A4Z2INA6_9TELE|nr:Ras-related protein Rab-22A [Liparis tanakae]
MGTKYLEKAAGKLGRLSCKNMAMLGTCSISSARTVGSEYTRASFMTKTVQYQNELHKFLIWDTAGQERFRALAPMYYRGSAAAIIVYDITKEESFQTLKNWVKELRQHGPPNIVVAIAGNKCDLSDAREVPEKDAKDYADSIHAIFVESSAKNAININEVFIEISRRIPLADAAGGNPGKAFKLGRQASESRRTCC